MEDMAEVKDMEDVAKVSGKQYAFSCFKVGQDCDGRAYSQCEHHFSNPDAICGNNQDCKKYWEVILRSDLLKEGDKVIMNFFTFSDALGVTDNFNTTSDEFKKVKDMMMRSRVSPDCTIFGGDPTILVNLLYSSRLDENIIEAKEDGTLFLRKFNRSEDNQGIFPVKAEIPIQEKSKYNDNSMHVTYYTPDRDCVELPQKVSEHVNKLAQRFGLTLATVTIYKPIERKSHNDFIRQFPFQFLTYPFGNKNRDGKCVVMYQKDFGVFNSVRISANASYNMYGHAVSLVVE